MKLSLAARKAITKAQLAKWSKATRSEKTVILDAVCHVTGWHRDHASKAIWQALAEQARGGPAPRTPRAPARRYDDHAVGVLIRCWAALDGPAGKRLHAALPETLANMQRHDTWPGAIVP